MSLCDSCHSINLQRLTSLLTDDSADGTAGRKERRTVHLKCISDLAESARHCPLCALIEESLSVRLSRQDDLAAAQIQLPGPENHGLTEIEQNLISNPLWFTPMVDPLGCAFPHSAAGGIHVRGFEVNGQRNTRGNIELVAGAVRLYTNNADDVTQLKDFILGRQRLPDSGGEEAFNLIRKWLRACRDEHIKCRETFSGAIVDESTLPELPMRVVDVGSIDGTKPARIFESNGAKARYIALSHCWGSQERPPLTTTRGNLREYCHHIEWSTMPRTFQDAITTVRQIGLQYIWIDSLCIVQDDQDEWLRESVKMGSIYERAELTIAASHSPDSWHGLFLPRSASPPIVELPQFFKGERASTRVFATIRRDQVDDIFPEHGSLSKRAWATQEWLLSRRMVFYTNGQIIWSCKTLTQRETGEKFHSTARNPKWKNVIEQYSERQLTHSTDRLIALEGLKTELQKKTGDTYLYGLWKSSLPDQLLWQITQKVHKPCNPLQLPSWTWASVPCSVRFVGIYGAKSLCKSIKWRESSGLFVCAKLKQIGSLQQTRGRDKSFPVPSMVSNDIITSNAKQTHSLCRFFYTASGENLGWAVFDLWTEELDYEPLFCLALMGTRSRRDEENEQRTGVAVSRRLRVYWVLVLRRCDDMPFTYERVGVGKTYGREWWQDTTMQEIKLV
ncbi:HET-domain-containing protein [Acephala macrosclerotiorum]|nr:HET-domain-containing protein [Acephala macrosclerotiorum]